MSLLEVVTFALGRLFREDAGILDARLKEECINHRFAVHLTRELVGLVNEDYFVDIEYDKLISGTPKQINGDCIRPDIIVHKRTERVQDNLFVIEAKKGYCRRKDYRKIEGLVSGELGYRCGFAISYLVANQEYARVGVLSASRSWKFYRFSKVTRTIAPSER